MANRAMNRKKKFNISGRKMLGDTFFLAGMSVRSEP
jgi:hypothetical protein